MRVIIPAAGLGTRLKPFTKTSSKALVPIGEQALIAYTMAFLHRLGIADVVVVLGHHGETLRASLLSLDERPELLFVNNPIYASTNSVYSLFLTTHLWTDDLCVIDSDVLASPGLLARLVEPGPSALVVDTGRSYAASDMKVEMLGGAIWHMDKTLGPEAHHGEFFGLSRWSGEGRALLRIALDEYIAKGRSNVWYEFPIRDVAKRTSLGVIGASQDEWAEIDRAEDIPVAERLVQRLAEEQHERSR